MVGLPLAQTQFMYYVIYLSPLALLFLLILLNRNY